MSVKWDIAAYNRHKQLVLVGEVKTKLGTSPEWAEQFWNNIREYGEFSFPEYFLLAFPDRFYLWKENAHTSDQSADQPDFFYTVNARPLLQPYFEQVGVEMDKIYEDSFEMLLAGWLGDIIRSGNSRDMEADESQRWLIESGLYEAISGGSVKCEVPV